MRTHGGGSPKQDRLRTGIAGAKKNPNLGRMPRLSAFTHFLKAPGAGEAACLCHVGGAAPTQPDLEQLQPLMRRLATRMTTESIVSDPAKGRDNPNIPSGYTYFLQFVAHDLVATSVPLWATQASTTGVRNVRAARLQLESLYGGGPNVNPAPFAPDDALDTSRTKFRLGQIQAAAAAVCPYRDVARVTVTGTDGIERAGLTEPLLGDTRNDDNPILAQMTVLFQKLHNEIVDLIKAGGALPAMEPLEAAEQRFAGTRAAVTLIYRAIIRTDLLPKILLQQVRGQYGVARPEFLMDAAFRDDPFAALPLEFSFGAMRFGHAMVRDTYQVNDSTSFRLHDVLNETSSRSPGSMPLSADWIVQWSHFFELVGGVQPNLSQRICPTLSPGLMNRGFFGAIDGSDWFGLGYRDLMSAAYAGMWSVGPLVQAINDANPARLAGSKLLRNGNWKTKLEAWLVRDADASGLTSADIETLVADPPLPFFILFEAEAETGGTTLGTLGSVIVADIFYALLAQHPGRAMLQGTLADRLKQVSTAMYGVDVLSGPLGNLDTMPKLITYLAPAFGGAGAAPKFI